MKRILIINPFGIGDVLFTTPIIESIKAQSAGNYIGYLCNVRTAPLLLSDPRIDKVFIYEKDEYRRLWKTSKLRCITKLLSFLKDIKKERFDIAFDLSLAQECGFFLMLAGIKVRVGYGYKKRGVFLTKKIPLIKGYCDRHMVDYYAELPKFSGIEPVKEPSLKVYIQDKDTQRADDILSSKGLGAKEEFICIAPGGGASWGDTSFRKQWPKERFAELTKILCNELNFKVLLLGSGDDKQICSYIKNDEANCINLCAEINLLTLAAILKKAKLLVTNDGGPLHIGVASGVKTVSIFGPVDDKVYGPYPKDKRHIVIKNDSLDCRPCYKAFKIPECSHRRCLEDIPTEAVTEAVKKILET